MGRIKLGRTGLVVEKQGFGCLPIQRISKAEAVELLHRAYDGGMNYFDTARAYSDSEEKVGAAFAGMRDRVILATKTAAQTADGFWKDLESSLRALGTDHIDVYQFHNPAFCPKPGDGSGLYEAMLEARRQGKIRFISITNHRMTLAHEAIRSGLYDTLQFPFCYLASKQDLELVRRCQEADMGFIAMKGLSGGLLNNAEACYAYMQAYDNVVPIWGIQREEELDEWLDLTRRNPQLTPELQAVIEKDRKDLAGEFCRSCGYCLPCAAGIDIPQAARMSALLRRSPYQPYMSDEWYAKMQKIRECIHCNACKSRCPYGLDTPALLQKQLLDYNAFYAQHHNDQ